MSKNLSALSFRKGVEKNVFERMVDAADKAGTAEKNDVVHQMGQDHLFGDAITLGAVSFYDFLKKENEGKKVFVCNGSACLCAGTQDKLHQPYRGALMPPSTELIALFRSKGYAAAVSGAGPCVLVLHYGNAREAIDQIASEQLASGHWRVLHLPINTAGVEIERR